MQLFAAPEIPSVKRIQTSRAHLFLNFRKRVPQQFQTKQFPAPIAQRRERTLQLLDPLMVRRLIERTGFAIGQRHIVDLNLEVLATPHDFPPRGDDLEPRNLQRHREQILGAIERCIFFVQHQQYFLCQVLGGFPR